MLSTFEIKVWGLTKLDWAADYIVARQTPILAIIFTVIFKSFTNHHQILLGCSHMPVNYLAHETKVLNSVLI